ncbi:Trp repressor binding protein [Pseudohyphozyma bogoriensis]|nr:Trp repressor binding protein [Pseudohyphozyma bogoriensis]
MAVIQSRKQLTNADGKHLSGVDSSTYGHIRTVAEKIAESAKEAGAEVTVYQFPEILSPEVLAKMHAAPKADYPTITPDDLKNFDGFLFGIPTRYGRAVACASAFFDATGGLWGTGALVGKFAGIFASSASQHGGQETTALTTLPFLAHHGIAYVPIGFAAPQLTDNSEIVAGSAYGAGSIAGGDGSRGVTEKELAVAAYQGKSFAEFVGTFVAGKAAKAAAAAGAEVPVATASPTETTEPEKAAPSAETPAVAAPAAAAATEKPAAAAPTPATQTPAPAKTTSAPAKKSSGGGFFCCGGKSENYDS